jgi:allantoin racemase
LKHALLINPNTTQSVTDSLLRAVVHVQNETTILSDVTIHGVTAAFGVPYISHEVGYAIAGHATLNAWDRSREQSAETSAVLIGCFGDPGLWALREHSGVPVTGLAEASFIEAARHGSFAVVTGGAAWKPMLERLAFGLGYATQMQLIHTIDATGAQLAADPIAALTLLRDACARVASDGRVRSIIIGGAGLAGYALRIEQNQKQFDVPLIDSVDAGARQLHRLLSAV